MDRLTAMKAFVRVVEAGSFAKAAETLDVPRPTVTRLIQRLERDLRVRLLERTTRSVTPTNEGAAYYDRLVRVLSELAEIESAAKNAVARPSGRLRVDVATAIATNVLIPALPEFYHAYPHVELEFGICNGQTDPVADRVHCAVRAGPVEEQFVVARRIGEFRMVLCASPEYLSTFGNPGCPMELGTRHQLIGLISKRTGKPLPFQLARGVDRFESAPHSRFSVDDTHAYLAAGLAGLGVMQAPTYLVQAALRSGLLVPVLHDWQTRSIPVHVVYRPNEFLAAKVRVFIDWVVTLFQRNPLLRIT